MAQSGAVLEATGEAHTDQTLFGKYELGKLVGCGAFAKVYHARNLRTGQSVAVKVLSKQKVAKGTLAAHVKREISIMRRLRHPNIVKLFEVLATKSKIYFVLEFAKGGEIFTKVSKGRFSEDLSRRYFQQLISAVGFCHSRGVFHRDLKLENLLLDENWDLKVSDFGLSALAEQILPDGMLHTLCGTPAYVAPEILAKNGYDGSKVDIWSCGVILYVFNAGYLPFNDANLMVMYRKIYKGEFRVPKWTSPDLRCLLSRLLDTNPETRITVDDILRDPWFKKGYKEKQFHLEDLDLIEPMDSIYLNAFDIISFSSGFNLSGLLNDGCKSEIHDRFVSRETPDRIVEKMEEVAKRENLKVTKKKKWGMKMEGQNSNFIAVIEIHRLTEELVVVETRKRETEEGRTGEIWKDKVRPHLRSLIYEPEESGIR